MARARARARAMAMAMAMAMRVPGKEEDKSGKAMAMVMRVTGKRMATATKRAMVTKTRESAKEEGNGKGKWCYLFKGLFSQSQRVLD